MSRRFYATLFAATAAISLAIAILNLHNLPVLEAAMIAGTFSAGLANNALGGWLSTVIPTSAEAKLSAWFTIANIGASGVMVILATETIHHTPLPLAATTFSLLAAASNLPLIYMQIFDGRAYASHGVTGAYLADALICIAACLVLGLLLVLLRKLSPRKQQEPA